MTSDISKYNRECYYNGRYSNMPEVRLLLAIIAQACNDLSNKDIHKRREAEEFLNSSNFMEYELLLERIHNEIIEG